MVPLSIDITEIVEEFALTATQSKNLGSEIIDRVVWEYMYQWENLVNKGLKKTRSLYKRAMYVERVNELEVVFGLQPGQDGLALALEEGKPPFDEKPFFAQSEKRKQTLEGGWYVTVPFRYATPGTVAESMMFQGVLPKEIYNIAKGNDGRPITQAQLPPQYAVPGVRKEIKTASGVIPEYVHKSPKFQGLVKLDIASTPNEKRSGYFTFRRVSNNSEPLSWMHPGFEARKFMEKAIDEAQIEEVAEMVLDNFLSQI